MSTSSSLNESFAVAPSARPDLARVEVLLPPLLSAIAGAVDVISFVKLKLFTAHITGNLVVIAALVVRGGPPNVAEILAVPVFVLGVCGVWLIARRSRRRGAPLIKPLLGVQFLLLVCVLVLSVAVHPAPDLHGLRGGLIAMVAVTAMACQFSLLRLALPSAPSTAVMTGNMTNSVQSLLDELFSGQFAPAAISAKQHLKKTAHVLAGFLAGCLAGAAAVSWLGDWAWVVPVILAGGVTGWVPGE